MLDHVHGEDGGHGIQRSDEDSYLTDPNCQQQSPGGLAISLPMTKDLRKTEIKTEGLIQYSIKQPDASCYPLRYITQAKTINTLRLSDWVIIGLMLCSLIPA